MSFFPQINTQSESHTIVTGFEVAFIRFKMKWTIFRLAISKYKNPITAIKVLSHFTKLRASVRGKEGIKKMIKANGKYYFGVYAPSYYSDNFKTFVLSEMNRIVALNDKIKRFNTVYLSVTKKCILQCEHCFEWEELNKKDVLSPESLDKIISIIQQKGVNQIFLTGGEPMVKLDLLLHLIEKAQKDTDFWVFTSGYHFNLENAKKLKKTGLKGVVISLDHFNPDEHNRFRNNSHSYDWVMEAVNSALAFNFIVALSLCITKPFATEENLLKYMELAKELNVSFVQFLDPKKVGHYKGKDISLSKEQEILVEEFFIKMNNNPKYREFPVILYHGYHQRRNRCFNAGLSGIYIDTNGEVNPCPFCHEKSGKILDDNFEQNLEQLTKRGCPSLIENDI